MNTRLSPDEIKTLLAEHEPMAWWLAYRILERHPRLSCDREVLLEELAAEARLHFVHSAQTFDPSRGATFATYLFRVAQKRLAKRLVTELARGVHVPEYCKFKADRPRLHSLDSLDGQNSHPVDHRHSPPSDLTDLWPLARRLLSPRQFCLLELRFRDGLSQREVAVLWSLSRTRIFLIEQVALQRLRKRLKVTAAIFKECPC